MTIQKTDAAGNPSFILPNKKLVIAIDGPAASGKGSLARKLAEYMGYEFLDTGALYRRVALKAMENGITSKDTDEIICVAKAFSHEINQPYDDNALRNDTVGDMASQVAQIQQVRSYLIDFQRNFANNAQKGAVLDGRDIGTVIYPEADIKLFITASTEKRAERRFKELQLRGFTVKQSTVLAEMQERDLRDSERLNAHLSPKHVCHVIDTSAMTPQEVLDAALTIIQKTIS